MKFNRIHAFVLGVAVLLLSSCSAPKDITYFQDVTTGDIFQEVNIKDIRVMPGDKISIVVNSKDPVLSDLFNLPVISHRVGAGGISSASNLGSSQYVSYYTVDPEGYIDFPILGELHIAGLTRHEVTELIKKRLMADKLVQDPVVTMEYVNTGISVMGEVASPGRYDINKDRLNILEALSLAGDLTINGLRTNVKVIREENGKARTYLVDLTDSKSLQNSPVYYLQQNDIIYVEPNNLKKRSATVNGNNVLSASFWVSVASLLTSIAVLIFK